MNRPRAKRDTEDYKREVFDMIGDEYSVLGEYKTVMEPVLMRHNKCGHEWNAIPNSFLNSGTRCPKCFKSEKKTTEQFKTEVFNLVSNEYTVLGEYEGSVKKIKLRHNVCGHVYLAAPVKFLSGRRCPHCAGKTWTVERFKGIVQELTGNEYELVGKFTTMRKPVLMRHNLCGYEWEVSPNHFRLSGSRCPKCAGVAKKNQHIFIEEVADAVGDEYTVLGEYKNFATKVRMRHNVCGQEWNITPASFLSTGTRCPLCGGTMKKSCEWFEAEVFRLAGDAFKVIGTYKTIGTKILMRHNACGFEYEVRPSDFLYKNVRCLKCAGNMKKDTEQFKKEVFELVGDEYTVLGEYVTSGRKLLMKHSLCGHEYLVTPNKFMIGRRCPRCKESLGEKKIARFFEDKYAYKREYTLPECRNIYPLPFDFAIFGQDGTLLGLVEYDGVQHFRASFGQESYEVTTRNDRIKNEYCERNLIPLLRIRYWEFDTMEEILEHWLDEVSPIAIRMDKD